MTKNQRADVAAYRAQQKRTYERDSRHGAITRSQLAVDSKRLPTRDLPRNPHR